MSEGPVSYSMNDGVALFTMDDGKANAFSHVMLDALIDAFARARSDEAGALVVATVGRGQ